MQVTEFTWSTKFKIFKTNNIYSVGFSLLHLMMDCLQGIMRMGVLVVWRWWIMLTCYCGPWIIHHPQRCMWYWPCRMMHSSMWYINYTPKAMTSWWLTFFVHISNLCWEKYEPATSYSQFVCTLLWSRKQQMQVIWVLGKSLLFAYHRCHEIKLLFLKKIYLQIGGWGRSWAVLVASGASH